jgi:hypothetical protein
MVLGQMRVVLTNERIAVPGCQASRTPLVGGPGRRGAGGCQPDGPWAAAGA